MAAFQTDVQQVFSDGADGAENKQVHNQVRCRIDVSGLVQLIQCKERANHDGENNHGLYNFHPRIAAVEFRNGGRDIKKLMRAGTIKEIVLSYFIF